MENEPVKEIDYKGYTVKIVHDLNPDQGHLTAENNPDLFLVAYHKQFYVPHEEYTEDVLGELLPIGNDDRCAIVPVKAYIHSGIALSLTDTLNVGGWDTLIVGAVFVDKTTYPTKEKRTAAAQSLLNEWQLYLDGNVYGYIIEFDGEYIDSCYGFATDDINDVVNEATAIVDGYSDDNRKQDIIQQLDHYETKLLQQLETLAIQRAQYQQVKKTVKRNIQSIRKTIDNL